MHGIRRWQIGSDRKSFVGESQAFVDFVHHVATATIGSNETGSLDSEHVLALQSSSKSVKTALEEAIVAIRENLGIASAIKWTSDDGMLVSYVHGKVSEGSAAGSSAAMVELVGSASVSPEVIREAGRKVAMHIVASKPTYLNVEDIPEEILAKERAILQSQVRFVRFSLGVLCGYSGGWTCCQSALSDRHTYVHVHSRTHHLLFTAWRFHKAPRRCGKDCFRTAPKVLRRSLFDGARAHGGRRWTQGRKGSRGAGFENPSIRSRLCLE
jgi:Elongation factor TS